MSGPDVRWHQRLANFLRALRQLDDAVALAQARGLTDLEKQGLIQAFEYTHELAWNTAKDFYVDQGVSDLQGSKDVARLAFKRGLIKNGTVWMDMIKSRNKTSHTYNPETAEEIFTAVVTAYHPELERLAARLMDMKSRA